MCKSGAEGRGLALVGAGLMVGLADLTGLFQPKLFYDFDLKVDCISSGAIELVLQYLKSS